MGTLVFAYLLGWLATSAYVGWLALQNARLAARQKELQRSWQEQESADRFYSKVA